MSQRAKAPTASRTGGPGPAKRTPAARTRPSAAAQLAAKQTQAEAIRQKAAELEAEDSDAAVFEDGHIAPDAELEDEPENPQHEIGSEDEDDIPVTSSDDFQEASGQIHVVSADGAFVTPTKKSRRRDDDDDDGFNGPGRDGPAKRPRGKDMTPRTNRLATKARQFLVVDLAMSNPYVGVLDRIDQVQRVMEKAADMPGADPELGQTLRRLKGMPNLNKYNFLCQYIIQGRPGFFNSVSSIARRCVAALGFPGTFAANDLSDLVTWCVSTEAYKFGGFSLVDRSFDKNRPFEAAFLEALPRAMFMEGRGKQNSEVFRFLIDLQSVPTVFMALTMTVIEHGIQEWREGSFRRMDFRDDASTRYHHHLAGLQHVVEHAPKFMAKIQAGIFKSMLVHTNKTFLLETAVSPVMASLDFAALEASAV